MKPSEFPGWMELELDDYTEKGDVWFKVKADLEPNPSQTVYFGSGPRRLGDVLVSAIDRGKYRAFRRIGGPRSRRPLNPHFSEPLPLP